MTDGVAGPPPNRVSTGNPGAEAREAVIVEGPSEAAAPPGLEFGAALAAAFSAKYAALGYSPEAGSWEGPDSGGLRVFTPLKAMAWFEFPADVTRFRF